MKIINNKDQEITLDLFDRNNWSNNTAIVGGTGAGKTVFAKGLIQEHIRRKGKVVIFDIGGNYRDICEAIGGKYIKLGNMSCLSLFRFLSERILGKEDCYYLLIELLLNIVEIDGNNKDYKTVYLILGNALDVVLQNNNSISLTSIYEVLVENTMNKANAFKNNDGVDLNHLNLRLTEKLKLYTLCDKFGDCIETNDVSDNLYAKSYLDNDLIVLDFDGLYQKCGTNLYNNVMLAMLVSVRINQEYNSIIPLLCIMEDISDLFKFTNISHNIILMLFRCRKVMMGIISMTQANSDFNKNECFKLILGQSATRIYFPLCLQADIDSNIYVSKEIKEIIKNLKICRNEFTEMLVLRKSPDLVIGKFQNMYQKNNNKII